MAGAIRPAVSMSHSSGTMRFANGVLAQFDSGFHAAFRAEMELVGTEGLAELNGRSKVDPTAAWCSREGTTVSLCRSILMRPTPAKSTTLPRLPSTGNLSA